MVDGRFLLYVIHTKEYEDSVTYLGEAEATYLGNNKEEKIMKEQKVDCSALYPYFDSLANDEATLTHTNIPVYVKQQLRIIHELFEGVLDLSLGEVKTLYFERKMSKQEIKSEYKKFPKTVLRKIKDLQPGDKVVIPKWLCNDLVGVNVIDKERELVLLN
jgi:hypothetical protein